MNSLHNLHNKIINIDKGNYQKLLLNAIKSRSDYLNKSNVKYIHDKIKKKDHILFLSNDLSESLIFENYKLISHGILPCGTKTTIIINKIYPYVDLDYDESKTESENIEFIKDLFKQDMLKKMLKNKSIDFKNIALVKGKHLMYFQENDSKFIRISFNKLYHRICFIRVLNKLKINSYNNDLNNYYRVVSRTFNLNLSSWNLLSNYTININSKYKSTYVFTVDINNITSFDSNTDLNKLNYNIDIDLLRNDKTISMCFDIEQYSSNFNSDRPDIVILPSGKIKEDEIFNICMTYQFINQKNSFLNIGLVTKECNEHEDYLTIICDNEKTLLRAFGYINSLMCPDYIIEFNGSEFDWINIYDKCIFYDIIQDVCQDLSIKTLGNYDLALENIDKYIYVKHLVKISADVPHKITRNIKVEGYIAFDLRVIFMQLNPTQQKSSLKFYLEKNNLPSKDDMPIPELFKIYRENIVSKMTDVVHYCYIDSYRLHQLCIQNNIIQDRREVAKLSFTSLFDGFYRAGGCKVRNLIINEAIKRNLFVNAIKDEIDETEKMEGKYPGALVLKPKRGLINNILTIEEFTKDILKITDPDIIKNLQEIIKNNYEAVYIEKNINNIKMP